MKNSKKIIVMFIVLVIGMVYIINKTYNNKNVLNNKQEEPKVREKMAIKVENDDGKYVYASSFPGAGYVINNDMTECVDQAGNKVDGVSFSSDGTSVTVTSKYTAYCTLYFRKIISLGKFCDGQTNMSTCISSKKSNIGKVDNMTSNEVGGMYRYQGTDGVNNWICFGTNDKSKCTQGGEKNKDGLDKYMYRIIGVTPNGELALIKETKINSEGYIYSWNGKYSTSECGTNGSGCTWANSEIYNRINGLCNSTNQDCTGEGYGMLGHSNIFIGNSYYEYLQDPKWLNKIINHEWKYGESQELDSYNGDSAYAIESKFPNSVPDTKIGLQYLHDYYYAYPNGNPGNYSTASTSWIHLYKDNYNKDISAEFVISKFGVSNSDRSTVRTWEIVSAGNAVSTSLEGYQTGVRPVFYLGNFVKISSTAGTKDDPFIITN